MRGPFVEHRSPEKAPSPDRSITSKLHPSAQPSLKALERNIYPVYLHQRLPLHSEQNSSKIMNENEQYLPTPHRSTVHQATVKKHKYFFSDLEDSQNKHHLVTKPEIVTDEASLKVYQYYERQIENLKAIVEELRSESSIKDQISILQKENYVLRENYDKIRGSYLQLQRKLKVVELHQFKSINLESELMQTRVRLQQATQQIQHMSTELTKTRGRYLEKEQKILKQSKETQYYLQDQIKQLSDKLKEMAPNNQNMTLQYSQHNRLNEDNQRLTEELARLKQEHHNNEVISKQHTEEIIVQYKSIIDYKNSEMEQVLEGFSNLKQLLTQINFEAIESDYDILKKNRKTKEHQSVEIQKLETIIDGLTNQNKRLRQEQVTLKTEILTLKTDSQLLNSHVRLLRTEKESLLAEIQLLKQSIQIYLKSEYSTKSFQIEAKLISESFNLQSQDRCYELEHLRQIIKSFKTKLDKLCQQVY